MSARGPVRGNSGVTAIARKSPDGWYVYWDTSAAYGIRGRGLTEERAVDLARRLTLGEERP